MHPVPLLVLAVEDDIGEVLLQAELAERLGQGGRVRPLALVRQDQESVLLHLDVRHSSERTSKSRKKILMGFFPL